MAKKKKPPTKRARVSPPQKRAGGSRAATDAAAGEEGGQTARDASSANPEKVPPADVGRPSHVEEAARPLSRAERARKRLEDAEHEVP